MWHVSSRSGVATLRTAMHLLLTYCNFWCIGMMTMYWQVTHCLGEMLDLCQLFCGLVSHSEAMLSAQESARLEDIATVSIY